MSLVLLILGTPLLVIGGLWLIVTAFQQNVWWGLAYILIPFAAFVFMVMHWNRAKVPFLISCLGCLLFVLGGGHTLE